MAEPWLKGTTMHSIREIVEELARTYGCTDTDSSNVGVAYAFAEFCDAVRALEIADETIRAEARYSAKQIAAATIGALLPEISNELAARLADRRISEAA